MVYLIVSFDDIWGTKLSQVGLCCKRHLILICQKIITLQATTSRSSNWKGKKNPNNASIKKRLIQSNRVFIVPVNMIPLLARVLTHHMGNRGTAIGWLTITGGSSKWLRCVHQSTCVCVCAPHCMPNPWAKDGGQMTLLRNTTTLVHTLYTHPSLSSDHV